MGKEKIDPELIELATHIIDKKQAAFDPSGFDDRYEDALMELHAQDWFDSDDEL